jgi:hypothetical protein
MRSAQKLSTVGPRYKNAMVSERVEVLMANKVLIAKGPSLPRKAPVDEMYN